MESKPILGFIQRAIGNIAIRDIPPLLPTSQKDVTATQASSPPPSPCKEVVVLNGFGVQVSPPASIEQKEQHPAFKVAIEYKKWKKEASQHIFIPFSKK
jgi:hypothetical protein